MARGIFTRAPWLPADNLSVLGLTIDYGPFGFLDRYDPGFIPNHSDDSGRYSYRNQPGVCKWYAPFLHLVTVVGKARC
jgi:uncharacterized protein YdiU (UPF0061 family)